MTLDSRTSIGSTDQAQGLRTLFGSSYPKVFILSSSLDPESTAAIGLGTAQALQKSNFKVLLVDEVPVSARSSSQGLAYPVQYDLAQALAGLVPLEKSIRHVEENLWYVTGSRMRTFHQSKKIHSPPLDRILHERGYGPDFIVVATNDPYPPALSSYSKQCQSIVIASVDDSRFINAMTLIRDLSIHSLNDSIPIMMVGGENRAEGEAAFEVLKRNVNQYLEQKIHLLFWVAAKSLQELSGNADSARDNETLLLPSSLFKQMAHQITS